MEFSEKQFDGPYEVIGIEINIEGEMLRGVLYLPPSPYEKPHPIIIYFHGFPQLTPFQDIAKEYSFLLNMGYVLLIFNFRGYQISDGKVSLKSQLQDAFHVLIFTNKLAEESLIQKENINIIAHDLGGFIACICCKERPINKLLLLNPILNLSRHVHDERFKDSLKYINHFLPGHVRGIEDVEYFVKMTKEELSDLQFKFDTLRVNEFLIILGDNDKITPLSEVNAVFHEINQKFKLITIPNMDHECLNDEELEQMKKEIKKFFTS
ncbi:MAG: alpha/beta hydrolase family protein [Promethearchaeota archaeon]